MRLAYKWQAALVTAIGLFMAVLDNTIVNVALPSMQTYFHTNRDTITWVATGYFLAQAAVIPITGYLSDRIGTKRVFMGALALFTLGSGLCAIAPSEQALIGFRVLQGIGGGALFPIVFAIVYRVFPPSERGPASAIVGVPVLLAPAFGPTIGGYLTTTFDWHAIFTVNLPVGVAALILSALVLRGHAEDLREMGTTAAEERRQRFDVAGLLLAMGGFTALVYGISEAGASGWRDITVDRFLIAGGVLLVAFVVVELLVRDPVLDVRLLANYTFTIANVLMWAVSGILFGTLLLLPAFFESVQGKTALDTGLILIPQGIAAAITTAIAGRTYNRVGPRIQVVLGFVLITIGTFGLTALHVATHSASLQVWLVLRGLGLGLTTIPLQTLALSVVSNRAMARASSLATVTRTVFGAVGISVLTTYFTQQTATRARAIGSALVAAQRAHTPPTGAAATCLAQVGPVVSRLQGCVVAHASTFGLNDTFFAAAVAAAICTVLAVFVGRDPAVEAAKRAAARGEEPEERQPVSIGE